MGHQRSVNGWEQCLSQGTERLENHQDDSRGEIGLLERPHSWTADTFRFKLPSQILFDIRFNGDHSRDHVIQGAVWCDILFLLPDRNQEQ